MSRPESSIQLKGQRVSHLVKGLIGLFCLIILGSAYYWACRVQGVEFNPVTWQTRGFYFLADPLTNYQIRGVVHSAPPISISSDVTKLIATPKSPPVDSESAEPFSINRLLSANYNRWDLVEISDYRRTSSGPAQVLALLLMQRQRRTGGAPVEHWNAWSAQHPKKAAVFWPAVQQLAVLQVYSDIPALFELTLVETTESEFRQALSDHMATVLAGRAQASLDQQDRAASLNFALVGLTYSAEHQQLLEIVEAAQPARPLNQ
ncbi:MAG: hypothetical protein KF752_05480 [Pirellulaceae bacterium]|nr:hypothetical protein [Pirellulaceae bacterium]